MATRRLTIDVFPPPERYRPLADFETTCIASTDTAARPVGQVKPREPTIFSGIASRILCEPLDMVTLEGLVDWRGSSSHPDIITFTTARTRNTTGRKPGKSDPVPGV